MSVNSLLYPNRMTINAGIMSLSALSSGGTITAPIETTSNVTCSNLNAEFWSGKFDDVISVGDILVCGNAITQQFVRLPVGTNGQVLTANSAVALGIEWV